MMKTALIFAKNAKGRYDGVYCNNGRDIGHVLVHNYTSQAIVEALIALGPLETVEAHPDDCEKCDHHLACHWIDLTPAEVQSKSLWYETEYIWDGQHWLTTSWGDTNWKKLLSN